MKRKIITLCGSTKFKKEYNYWNAKLTFEEDAIVISVSQFGHSDNIEFTKEQKEQLDSIHKSKIDISDEIFVIDVDGYVGDSTKSEIRYAINNNKRIRYLSKVIYAINKKMNKMGDKMGDKEDHILDEKTKQYLSSAVPHNYERNAQKEEEKGEIELSYPSKDLTVRVEKSLQILDQFITDSRNNLENTSLISEKEANEYWKIFSINKDKHERRCNIDLLLSSASSMLYYINGIKSDDLKETSEIFIKGFIKVLRAEKNRINQ